MENPPDEKKTKKSKEVRTSKEIATEKAKSAVEAQPEQPNGGPTPNEPQPATQPEKIVHAEDSFGKSSAPALPEFTLEDLVGLGITVVDSDTTLMIEVPMLAQKKLIESLKGHGFGASKALDLVMQKMLKVVGFIGKISMKADPQTFAWTAWQDKRTDAKEEAPAPPAPQTTEPQPVDDAELLHENIGQTWTVLLQQYYQGRLPKPISGGLVKLMLGQISALKQVTAAA